MKRFAVPFLLYLLPNFAAAIDNLALDVEQISASDWMLERTRLTFSGFNDKAMELGLTIDKMKLPEPFDHLSFIDVRCDALIQEPESLECMKGTVQVQSEWFQPSRMPFSFKIGEINSRFSLRKLKLAGGSVNFVINLTREDWTIHATANGINGEQISKLIRIENLETGKGAIDAEIIARGARKQLNFISVETALQGATAQTTDGRYAGENLVLNVTVNAEKSRGLWRWNADLALTDGALYIQPVFIEINNPSASAITINSEGSWNEKSGMLTVENITYLHDGLGKLQGRDLLFDLDDGVLEQGTVRIQSDHMEAVSGIYLEPFFEATGMEGVSASGKLDADIEFNKNTLTNIHAIFSGLDINDDQFRFKLHDGKGEINWSSIDERTAPSQISWENLDVYQIPIEASDLSMTLSSNSVHLDKPASLPVLDGKLDIHKFTWTGKEGEEPEIHFKGDVHKVSLEQLTHALDWTPLTGTINGSIPGVSYQRGELVLDGELGIRVFDGDIRIKELGSTGLFSDLPQLHGEIEISNLDLKQITNKFEFGQIEGRLSGYVRDFYLENWKPITFFAWLGTPEDDDSRHRISQKAVENIASIGGGGAADLISRSFLRFFDTFGYNKLGIGCYLNNGVCQLMGMEAAAQGYYIVKGGGLPRIDVIGYNSRVDWNVLLKRLERISSTEEAVVE